MYVWVFFFGLFGVDLLSECFALLFTCLDRLFC